MRTRDLRAWEGIWGGLVRGGCLVPSEATHLQQGVPHYRDKSRLVRHHRGVGFSWSPLRAFTRVLIAAFWPRIVRCVILRVFPTAHRKEQPETSGAHTKVSDGHCPCLFLGGSHPFQNDSDEDPKGHRQETPSKALRHGCTQRICHSTPPVSFSYMRVSSTSDWSAISSRSSSLIPVSADTRGRFS